MICFLGFIGGFALAARWNGLETIGFSEIDPYCCRVLEKNFPGVQNYGDIKSVKGIHCDLLTGGLPCQPFSCAGKRKGAEDDRYLWPEMYRVIAESKPRLLLCENVPGIVNMELDRVLSDLESIGYSAWPVVIPACAVDARHKRNRVWIMAHTARIGKRESANQADAIATCGQARDESCNDGEIVAYAAQFAGNVLWESWKEGLRLQTGGCHGESNPAVWESESGICRVADGIPKRMDRFRGLGNAIVPQVASVLIRFMLQTA